ncbi:hypothetical protein [Oceanobacillus saliphilus]|nr:hypothetical protein [Oceanobacillus saliphilus]
MMKKNNIVHEQPISSWEKHEPPDILPYWMVRVGFTPMKMN